MIARPVPSIRSSEAASSQVSATILWHLTQPGSLDHLFFSFRPPRSINSIYPWLRHVFVLCYL